MTKHYLIIGAGQAGRRMAESLRSYDSEAQIVLVGEENTLPYDRPALSKEGLVSELSLLDSVIQPAEFYESQRILLRLNTRAKAIHPSIKQVELATGEMLSYDELILCTGSRVRQLQVPGAQSVPLYYLRTIEDCRNLRKAAQSKKNVVVIGGGFIGLEVAATLKEHFSCEVSILESGDRILKRSMPKIISDHIHALHEKKGVRLYINTHIHNIEPTEHGTALIHTNHGQLKADLIVVGIGVLPNQELAAEAGVRVNNGIVVDAQGRTSIPHIYATGDVTSHYNPYYENHVRLESWQIAENHPEVIAQHITGLDNHFNDLPWLWSDQYEHNMQMLGDFNHATTVHIRQESDPNKLAYIGLNEAQQLKAVCTINQGRDMSMYRRLMASGCVVPEQITDPSQPLRSLQARTHTNQT